MSTTLPQRQRALAQANRVRAAMSAIKFELACGVIDIRRALGDERAGSITVFHLVRSLPRWGDTRTRKLLRQLQIGELRYCRDLTARQRDLIADTINVREEL